MFCQVCESLLGFRHLFRRLACFSVVFHNFFKHCLDIRVFYINQTTIHVAMRLAEILPDFSRSLNECLHCSQICSGRIHIIFFECPIDDGFCIRSILHLLSDHIQTFFFDGDRFCLMTKCLVEGLWCHGFHCLFSTHCHQLRGGDDGLCMLQMILLEGYFDLLCNGQFSLLQDRLTLAIIDDIFTVLCSLNTDRFHEILHGNLSATHHKFADGCAIIFIDLMNQAVDPDKTISLLFRDSLGLIHTIEEFCHLFFFGIPIFSLIHLICCIRQFLHRHVERVFTFSYHLEDPGGF